MTLIELACLLVKLLASRHANSKTLFLDAKSTLRSYDKGVITMGLSRKIKQRSPSKKSKKAKHIELRAKTMEVCREISYCAQAAIEVNNIYNVTPDGKVDESIGKMRVLYLPASYGSSTIVVVLPYSRADMTILGIRGFSIYQLEINLAKTNQELHLYNCPNGPEMYLPIDSLMTFKKVLMDRIATFQHHPVLNT